MREKTKKKLDTIAFGGALLVLGGLSSLVHHTTWVTY
jgi:hypothetical protein